MRSNPMVRVITLLAAAMLLGSGVVHAQALPTPPPAQLPDVRAALITSALTDPAINATLDASGAEAHRAVGGKRRGLWTATLETPLNVAIAGHDLADEGNRIVILSGGDSQLTVGYVGLFPGTSFVDIGQPVPCITPDGLADPSGTCDGGVRRLPSNYSTVVFAIDEPAYLAGIVAASASRRDRLGIIAGQRDCDECARLVEGFTLGAQSVKPGITVEVAYLSDDDVQAAFGDPAIGKTFAEAFINVHQPDVLVPIAGASSIGMIEAACEAGILAVGTETNIAAAYPKLADCMLASVTKDVARAVRESIFGVANRQLQRVWLVNLTDGGVTLSGEWRQLPGLPVDLPTRFETAQLSIQSGLLDTCPTACEQFRARTQQPAPSASPEPSPSADLAAG